MVAFIACRYRSNARVLGNVNPGTVRHNGELAANEFQKASTGMLHFYRPVGGGVVDFVHTVPANVTRLSLCWHGFATRLIYNNPGARLSDVRCLESFA